MNLRDLLQKTILLITTGLLVGCAGAGSAPPQIGEISSNPSTTAITVGDKASLTFPVAGNDLKFERSVRRGSLTDPTHPNVIYTAPDAPSPDIVTVKIIYQRGETLKSISFNVDEIPLPTTTPVFKDTPTPTAVPKPTTCIHPSVTKNLFPQLANITERCPIYGPETEPRFLC